MTANDQEPGINAYHAQNWREAYDLLSAADARSCLDASGLEYFANAAYLIGEENEAAELWTRAHAGFVDRGEIARAVRVGSMLSLTLLLKGEASISSGWLARTQRLLETVPGQIVEEGFCRTVIGIRELYSGKRNAALRKFESAIALATRYQDTNLLALSLLSRGQALIASDRSEEGVKCLDEAMVSVTSRNVAPVLSGIIYCAVILACRRIFDAERAREWTNAFNSWCMPQSDLVPFRGQCLIHRSEILQMRGDWHGAMKEARQAFRWLAGKSGATVGRAHYQKGELHRLFGQFDQADRSYRKAVQHGVDPQPGYSLLRLTAGQADAAAASIRTACGNRYGASQAGSDPERLKLLGPSVEIFLSAGQADTAIAAAEELAAGARRFTMPLLEAVSAMATGEVLAATDKPDDALAMLKASLGRWQELGMPYESARARMKLADVCFRLGDPDSARMHCEAARSAFRDLGAAPDLVAADRMPWNAREAGEAGLTRRQMDVLRQLAKGHSNREIALELHISEHTVARHVSNIFDRTGASSRAAVVAFAHRKGLLG